MNDGNIIEDKSLAFAVRVVRLYQYLRETKWESVMSKQILRCGTSIGANVAESLGGQSDADFIAKMHIALKECNESSYWLKLLYKTEYLSEAEFQSLSQDAGELKALLTSIIKSVKKRLNS